MTTISTLGRIHNAPINPKRNQASKQMSRTLDYIRAVLFAVPFFGIFAISTAQEVAPFAPRLSGGNIEIRGDIFFVGNNILNRATEANPSQANTPYNGTDNNNSLWMEYIDIDGDPGTFSSSSADLNIADPACSEVRYAGLYWAATYPNERSTNGGASFSGTPRIEDWFNIKFQVPGGAYVDLTADTAADPVGEEDDIIYDGYDATNINNSFKDSPYVCYKNITDLVRSNSNPNGTYMAANIRATKGRRNGSSSAGWVMVIIYENPNESGKFISTFDGYAGMSGAAGSVDVPVNGFRTLPAPFPVRARIGVGALEGDRRISNARFYLRANSNAAFTNLSTGLNPANNFFNSTITTNGAEVPTRNPYGTNTLGTDLDLFNLNNPPGNTVLPNDETGATLRFTSTGDGYGSFLAAFAVEIIEPDIVLEKRVENIAGDDITGLGVSLGQTLDYVLSFRNLGNDDAINYAIRDVLPVNTTYVSFDNTDAPGVTSVVDPISNEVTFSIPNDLVKMNYPVYSIRLRVKVAENCFDFVDACTDQIQNLAYSTYQGLLNSAVITDDPSVSDFDNCGFVTPGATNFLLDDLADCSFTRTVQLCGDTIILDAGDNFDSYVWIRDDNGNGLIDPSDTVLNDGDPDSDPSTLIVAEEGTYIVDKIVADPCKGFKEIMMVERFGSNTVNPVIDYFNTVNSDADITNDIEGEIVTCSIDGDELAKIFLCGSADSQLIQTNITDALSISWELLDETSCTAAPDDCANKNLSCTWNQVATGSSHTVTDPGKYRLVVTYQNGCFNRFYFDVFRNELNIEYTTRDIVCTTDGRINITNLGSSYGFQLVDITNNAILVPFSAANGPNFNIVTNGQYRVDVVQLDSGGDPISGGCVFSTPDIGILARTMDVDIQTTPSNCNNQGTIKIDINDVFPDYTYILRLADGTLIDDETAQATNTHTFNVNAGTYIIETSTADGCFDSQTVTVDRIPDPTLFALTTSNIACSAGTITLTRTGGLGNPDFLYAIWSKDGTDLYPNLGAIPPDAFQVDPVFSFGWHDSDGDGTDEYFSGEDGDYIFIIADANGCTAFSNAATINDNGPMTLAPTNTEVVCSGSSTASLTIGTLGGAAPFQYSIDDGATYQPTATFVNLAAGSYNLRVTDTSGCEVAQIYTITEPFTLSASAGVTEVVECNPGNSAEVRITNAQGGTAPYEYSFDGGASFGPSNIASLPAGTHNLLIRDVGNCEFPMTVVVPDPVVPPTFTPVVIYDCDGEGTITVNSSNTTNFDYTYELNTVPNTPADSNVFTDVPVGTQTVTVNYIANTPPEPSQLILEDFGVGPTTSIAGISEIDPVYCYEQQSSTTCDGNQNINDLQYSVTHTIEAPFGAWVSPNDQDDPINGRYYVLNVGNPGRNTIVYAKRGIEVIPNRDIIVSLDVINLVRQGTGIIAPNVLIELVDASNNIIASETTGLIPENTGPDNWISYTVPPLDPGANSTIDIVIRTIATGTSGNDIAIDNIKAAQIPEVCASSIDIPVSIAAGRAFQANVLNSTNVSCAGLSDGTITFEVANYDATAGFEYSIDGGTTYVNATSSPVTTAAIFAAGNQTIAIRKADDNSCAVTITRLITAPTAIIASAAITSPFTCYTTGATLTASASGGTPTYEFQLEDTGGGIVRTFQPSPLFNTVPAGSYIVVARDVNTCSDEIDSPITISAPLNPIFNAVPTACYSGANDGEIQVDIDPASIPGNGGFQFRISGGPWVSPTPVSATTHSFTGLANGTYSIEVRDAFGCTAPAQAVTINPQITANAIITQDLTCLLDASITINATGGSGTFTYEWAASALGPWNSSGFAANVYTTNTAGSYFFRITDTTTPAACTVISNPIAVTPAQTPVISSITPTNLTCNSDASGALNITIDTGFGLAPYTFGIVNTTTSVNYATQTSGLTAGAYEVTVTDAKGCSVTDTATITEPDPINYTVTSVPITCDAVSMATNPGSITIIGTSGGTAEYTYYLTANNGIPTQTYTTTSGTRDHTFNILNFGIYQIDIVDANGCAAFSTEIIASPPNDLDIDVSTATADCATGGTAIVTVGAAVGSGSYEFAVLDTFTLPYAGTYVGPDATPPGNTDTATFTGLTPGITYTFVVHDLTTDCYYFETADAPVDSPSNMTATLDAVANVTCTGAADGSISFTFDNYDPGATAVNYEIFNSQSNSTTGDTGSSSVNPPTGPISITDFATLPPGEYYLLLSEVSGAFAGCSVFGGEFTIRESVNLLAVDLAITKNDNCAINAGVITASGRFGTAPYQYQFMPAGSTPPTLLSWAGSATNVFNGEGGSYDVYIKDASNCIQTNSILLPTDASPDISLAISDECVAEGSYDVIVSLGTAGIAPYSLSINGGPFQNVTFNGSNQYTVSNLSSGAGQSIRVQDLNGCRDLENFTIQPPLEFNALLTTLMDCETAPDNNAEITIDVTAGSGAYEYEITGPVNEVRTGLPSDPFVWTSASLPGTYSITIFDISTGLPNCSRSVDVIVPAPVTPVVSIDSITDVTCNSAADGTITVSATDNGVGPYTFELVSATGGTASFPIASTLPPGTSGYFDGLEGSVSGIDYTIRVTGSNGCFIEDTQLLVQPEPIANITATVVPFGCAAGNTPNFATLRIDDASITGGSGNYVRYQFIHDTSATTVQDGTNISFTETNLAGGNYTITVFDANGCVGTTTAIIAPFVAINDPVITTNVPVTCSPGDDSEIQVSVTMTPPAPTTVPTLDYTVTGTDIVYTQTNTTGAFSGLGVGSYIISVTNTTTGCQIETTHTISDPNTIEVLATKLTDEECLNDGVADGSFGVGISSYTGNYTYQVYNLSNAAVLGFAGVGNTATPLVISNLPGGGYYVRITETEAPFCEQDSNALTISTPAAPITITATEQANVSCTNDQGALLVDPEGGTGPYTILLENTTTSQSYTETNVEAFVFDDLAAGSFTITVTDAASCIETESIVLIRPDSFVPTISTTPLVCFNATNATAFTTVPAGRNVSGTAVYEYRLNSYDDLVGTTVLQTSAPQNGVTFTGLSSGFYSITTTDNFGCSFTSPIEQIVNPTEVTAQLLRTNPLTCLTGIEFELTATGGLSGTYEYSSDASTWIPMVGTTATINEAIAGTYSYYVRDAIHGCAALLSNQISEDPIADLVLNVDASAAIINCNGENTADIYASAAGGLGEYQYQLFTDLTLTSNYYSPGHSQALGEFYDLPAGTYYVNVLSGDCYEDPVQLVIIEPTPLDYTETIVNVQCFGEENGSISVFLSGGSGGYQYAISPRLNQFDDQNTFDELAPGDYTVIAQDQNGCFIELQYTITEPEALSATATTIAEVCQGDENGAISLNIQGGTLPYSTRLSTESSFVQDRVSFTDLNAGGYIIFVQDANGCEIDLGATVDSGVDLNAVIEVVYECTGDTPDNYINISLEDSSVLGDVLYALDSTDPADMQLNPDFRNSAPGTHFIAIAHTNGCVLTIDFEIEAYEPLTLSLEQLNLNVITATAAGGKEGYTFYFDTINNGTDTTYRINSSGTYTVRVVDANGCEAIATIEMEFIDIEIPNFFTPNGDGLNDLWMPENQEAFPEILTIIFDRYGREVYQLRLNDSGWDGLYNDSELPTGDYWYVIKLRGENDEREFIGHFTLYR